MIKALLLDLHGVLISKFPISEYTQAVKEWLKKKGYEVDTYERWKEGFGTFSQACDYHNIRQEYLNVMDNLPVYSEDCSDMVELLRKSGFELYLATDSSRSNAIQTLKTAGYPPEMFKMIVTGNDVKFAKPNTEMYEKIINGNRDEWLIIGDRITDIIPAAKLGLKALLTEKTGLRWWLNEIVKLRGENSGKGVSD